jgi:hypothetical protein
LTLEAKNEFVRRVLLLWIACWLALIASLLLVWPTAQLSRVLFEKIAIAAFGVLIGVMAVRGRLRWQPWVCAPAILFLALHILLASRVWLTKVENPEGFWENLLGHISLRPRIVFWFFTHDEILRGLGFTIEQILVPALQLIILCLAALWWRLPPSNSTFESGRAKSGAPAQRER